VTLTAPCFCGPHWTMVSQAAGVPDYERMFDFHRRILQVLQHGAAPRTWLLKTPGHLMTLDLLFATYPDAWVVQTHRDPAKTMPSTVSTTAMVQWLRTDQIDLDLLATTISAVFSFALNNVAERRAKHDLPDRFVDVHFQELLRDPVATLRRAYQRMGRRFSDEHAEAIRRYLAEKPKGKFGTHSYSPEEWGFSAAELRKSLAPYIAHFGVALE
jgi:Sulfotransferase family